MPSASIIVAVLAHNEERRIAKCLASLPLDDSGVAVHVVVNGSTDRTAEIARRFPVTVHEYEQGGKSRSWNRFMLDTPGVDGAAYIFVDGDAQIMPGSVGALVRMLDDNPGLNAVAGLPCNGRRAETYRQEVIASHGLFGDLYALSDDFISRMRQGGLRLPDDLIGDDGLICAMAKTDLGNEDDWQDKRVGTCLDAGFLCEPTSLASPGTIRTQYRRMINYSVRHFQNRIISSIMRVQGPSGLPSRLASLYPEWLDRFSPRRHPALWWFDRKALSSMAGLIR